MKTKASLSSFPIKTESYNSKWKSFNTKKYYQFCKYQEDILTFPKLFLSYFHSEENAIKTDEL